MTSCSKSAGAVLYMIATKYPKNASLEHRPILVCILAVPALENLCHVGSLILSYFRRDISSRRRSLTVCSHGNVPPAMKA